MLTSGKRSRVSALLLVLLANFLFCFHYFKGKICFDSSQREQVPIAGDKYFKEADADSQKRAINEVQQSFEVVCEITISKERRREAGQEENEKLVKLFF